MPSKKEPFIRKLQKHSTRSYALDLTLPKKITDILKLQSGNQIKVSLVRRRIILELV